MRTKLGLGTAVMTLALAGMPAAQAREVTERKFVSGGTVRLDLDAGDYDIVASRDDRIRIAWDDRKHDSEVSLRVDLASSRATVRTDTPWHDGAKMRIELPRRSNLVVKMSAGDLTIDGIEGSKDVSAAAGDVKIGVGSRDQYRYVNASVRVGDLNTGPFNVRTGGLFRSFEWTGTGAYELRAHLTVGDLKLN